MVAFQILSLVMIRIRFGKTHGKFALIMQTSASKKLPSKNQKNVNSKNNKLGNFSKLVKLLRSIDTSDMQIEKNSLGLYDQEGYFGREYGGGELQPAEEEKEKKKKGRGEEKGKRKKEKTLE